MLNERCLKNIVRGFEANKKNKKERIRDKEIALELTKIFFSQSFVELNHEPLVVFKNYWRELATMV